MLYIRTIIFASIFASLLSSPLYAATNQSDDDYMRLAIKRAEHNPVAPFGAVIVDNKTGAILSEGVNAVAASHNPTLHGEMAAINNAVKNHKNIDWKNTTLYTTAEPCAMCQGAIIWAGIPRVVYGSSIVFLKSIGWDAIDITANTLAKKASFYHGYVHGGVLSDQTNALFVKSMRPHT